MRTFSAVVAGALACVLGAAGTTQALADSLPSGEHLLGRASVEPAYDDTTGNLVYLSTPINSPFPTHTSAQAVAPLYLVEYPPSYPGFTLNCMAVPGNCPDHDGIVAGVATQVMPDVYGTDVAAVPGHDHLVAVPGSGGDFNIAWEVEEVLFTNSAAANTHLTTLDGINSAVARGDAIIVDLGFAFHCSVVSQAVYAHGS
jgi:hypothetical protein